MSEFFGAIWWFIVTLGVLVTFHEFGHFWVARRCGVKVLRFSVGFGRPLWSRLAADGTRYQVAMIPLGGYVQFLDERENEVIPAERDQAFNRQPVLKRIAIVIAGPAANLLLCVALFWTTFMIGWPGVAPILGKPVGLAAEAGLHEGDRIIKVGDELTPTWNNAVTPLALAEIDRRPLTLTIEDSHGNRALRVLPLDRLASDFDQTDPLKAIGMNTGLSEIPPVVGGVSPDSPAAGKLLPGDRILRIGAHAIGKFTDIGPALQVEAASGQPVSVEFERGGQALSQSLSPHQVVVNGKNIWQLGVAGPRQEVITRRYGPVDAFRAALAETGKQSREMLGFIARLVTGKASSKNLSGVIGIAQVAQSEANLGASRLLFLMASLSLTLCIMNLLPIPVLDGGHLLYYLIELISGRPVGERVLIAGQYAGLLLLAGLICLAFYNDLVRTIS
jgi:regulator of sigma E protease